MNSFEISKLNIANNCFEKSPNLRKINLLILHHLQANSVEETIEALEIHGVSAHFLIDIDGNIFQIVEENDIAYHAGVSYWGGVDGLNKTSIGIEFINPAPFAQKFSKKQMEAGAELASYLINKYKIQSRYVLGHSDIGYHPDRGFLDRKQDPSHLFDWQFLAQKGVGLFPRNDFNRDEILLFEYGDKNLKIAEIKSKLNKFGYKISNINNYFDEEMLYLTRVFNRHYNNKIDIRSQDLWLESSSFALDYLMLEIT